MAADGNGDLPAPDPTRRTLELVNGALSGYREVVDVRLGAMDKATELNAREVARIEASLWAAQREGIANLREIIETRFNGMDTAVELVSERLTAQGTALDEKSQRLHDTLLALLTVRIDGMDVATKLLAEDVTKIPSDMDRAIGSLRDVIMGAVHQVESVSLEKFTAIEGTFASNALALTAALAAQKEAAAEAKKSSDLAIDKSEKTTQETIRANDAKTASGISAQAAVMADIKDRLIRLESGGVATAAARTETRAEGTYNQADRIAQVVQDGTRQMQSRMTVNTLIASVSALVALIAVIFAITHG